MKKRSVMFLFILSLLLIENLSAGVYFYKQPEANYNIGDTIEIEIEISPLNEGPIKIELMCDETYLVSYDSSPVSDYKFKLPINFANLPDLDDGTCYFSAEYMKQSYTSRTFEISKKLIAKLDKDSFIAKPGEEIIVSGNVKRQNGEAIEKGEVQINIPLLELSEQNAIEGLDDEWISKIFDKSEENMKKDNYLKIYNAIDSIYGDINAETDIIDVETTEEKVISKYKENKEAVISQKIRVEYKSDEENASSEKIIYLKVTTGIDNEEISYQDFEESEENDGQEDIENGMFFGKINGGVFSIPFSLTKDTPSGSYNIEVFVYETDSEGRKTSEGNIIANLKIQQILTSISVAVGKLELNPGEKITFKPTLADQAGYAMDGDISVLIKDSESKSLLEKIIKSGESVEYNLPTDFKSGYYDIKISSENFTETKSFYVNEKAMISFEILNQTLRVTNIGNVPYNKDIQINLGNRSFIRSINLGLGESQEFRLEGDDGQYDIWVSDGENELSKVGISLTGNAINVKAAKSGFIALKTPIIWIFFIIVLGGGILFLFKDVLKRKSIAIPFKNLFHRKPKIARLDEHGRLISEDGKNILRKKPENSSSKHSNAEQVLVLNGNKNRAAILALKIKNNITPSAKKGLESAIEHVYEKKGAVYEKGDFIFVVFSPIMTRSFKNEVQAIKSAERIKDALREYNSKFKDKIKFGVGINSGNIIGKVENKKLKFTALGNLIGPAKRLAEASNEEVLITKEVYERGISEVKAQKKQIKGVDIYEVKKVVDQEKNQKFIGEFLKRIHEEKK